MRSNRSSRKMHELGFLSHYIPEFAEIEGRSITTSTTFILWMSTPSWPLRN